MNFVASGRAWFICRVSAVTPRYRRVSSDCCWPRCTARNWIQASRSVTSRWRSCTSWCGLIRAAARECRWSGLSTRLPRRWCRGAIGCVRHCACDSMKPGRARERRYEPSFPASYRQDVQAAQAVEDILDLEGIDQAPERMQLRLYRPPSQQPHRVHLAIIRRGDALSVSDVLPTFEHFGLRVLEERPYRLDFADGNAVWIQDFELEHYALQRFVVARVATELIAAFRAVRATTNRCSA